jgi:aldehyde:ferredoxin oxidoreductase
MANENIGQYDWKGYSAQNTRHEWDLAAMRAAHRELAHYKYEPRPLRRGFANRTLFVDLGDGRIAEKPVTEEMKRKFTGGRGFGLKLLWESINARTRWDSPENELIITTGVMCGATQYPGSGKSLCLTVSPSTDIICDSNVGGFFGPYLKFSGFDALEIRGKASEDVVIVLDGQTGDVRVETAPQEAVDTHLLSEQLTFMYAKADDERARQLVSTVTAGRAAEHSWWGCLNFSFWDIRRKVPRVKQAGRGGLGTVLRDKRIKALVVISPSVSGLANDPADPELAARMGEKLHKEIRDGDRHDCNMRQVGTAHLVEIMDAYDLLPCENYRFGSFPKAKKIFSGEFYKLFTKIIPDGCWYGCSMACAKTVDAFTVMTGPYKGQKVTVDGPEYETCGCGSNMGMWDPRWILEFNFYCDTYGVDTISSGTAIAFYMEMYEYGILDKERCGGRELWFGNNDAALGLLHAIARGDADEFARVAGKGVRRVKDWIIANGWGEPALVEDCGMESKGLEYSEYVTKESLAMQGGYGLTLKGPQHDEAWLIFMDMVNNQIPTFKDKAEALYYFPMWRTWFGLNGLCKLPWNDIVPADNSRMPEPAKVPEHVENYVNYQNAITGWGVDKEELIRQSERCYHWQRAMNVWMGRGRRKDDWIPYRSMGPVTRMEYMSRADNYDKKLAQILGKGIEEIKAMRVEERMAALYDHRRNEYEKLADAVYHRRGWTPNGVPTPQKLRALGLGDEKRMLALLQEAIDADEAAGLNAWGGRYQDGEAPPTTEPRYWEKW